MKVCSNCGARIYIDSQNCTICGAPLIGTAQQNQQEQQNRQIQNNQPNQLERQNQQVQNNQQNQRRTVYDGEVHKCPSCGELLNSFMAMCPACGYEIRGARTSNFVSEFSLKLSQMSSDEEKSNLIRNFPIPNSKEDIYELLILASTNIGGSLALNVSEAWLVKIDQCYQKATLILGNNDELAKIKQIYDECHRKFNRVQRLNRVQENRINRTRGTGSHINPFQIIGRNLITIIGIILLIISVIVDKSGGNASGFELLGCVLLIVSAVILFKRQCYLSDFGMAFFSAAASICLSFLLDNGSLLILCGIILFIIVTIANIAHLCKKLPNNQATPVPPPSQQNVNSQTSTTVPTPTVSPSGVPTPITPTTNVLPSTVPTPTASTPNPSNTILNINVPSNPVVQSSSPPPTLTQPVCSVKIPRPVKNGSERNYAAVEALLVQAGFTNVKTVPLNDLFLGIMTTPGEIEKITVDGKDLGSYFRRTFDSDVPVLITYHSRRI